MRTPRPLTKNDQKVQNRIDKLSTPSNLISTRSSAPSSRASRTRAMQQDTAAFTAGRKVEGKTFGMVMGSKEIDSPSNFSSKQASTMAKAPAFKNAKKANRIATRAAKTRGKGEDALKSGNLAKAKRMRRRYDRQTKRLKKS